MPKPGILVVAFSRRGALAPANFELLSAGRALADALKEPLSAAVLSDKASALAGELAARGAAKVYAVEHPSLADFTEEAHAQAAALAAEKSGAGRVLIVSSVAGRALAARLSVLLKAGLAADVFELRADGRAARPIFAGNLNAELEFKTPVAVMTIPPMTFPRAEKGGAAGAVEALAFEPSGTRSQYAGFEPEESNEVDLGSAERVVAGGRGLGGPEGFKPLYELAHALGAAVGASRAAVDAGWIPYRHQVGLTGRSVRPKLYVAVGISGQIQHLAGMSSSGTVVAINTDKDCPMMQTANIAVQGDWKELVPLVTAEVKKRRGA